MRKLADLKAWGPKVLAVLETPRGLAAIPALYIVLFAIGVVRGASPVPFWDMWDSTVWFYLKARENGWREFLGFQNEHRIIFSKVLFWIDYHYFDARSHFLIAANFALLLGLWLAFVAIARRLLGGGMLWIAAAAILSVFCCSWLHEDNVTWGFQSQFIVAYLFPLLAFACLGISVGPARPGVWFIAAVLFALASLGTMANGLLALPLLVVMQLLLPGPNLSARLGRAALLALIAAAAIALWFQGYFFVDLERATPIEMVLFFTSYLGLPFGVLTGSAIVGAIGALLFVGASLFALGMWWRRRAAMDPLALALLTMIAYVAATGLLLAYGRGEVRDAALIPRYATPAFAGWSALLILGVLWLKPHARSGHRLTLGAFVIAFAFLPIQLGALGTYGPMVRQQRMHAALALQLDLYDPNAMRFIYMPDHRAFFEHVKAGADRLAALHRSIFADPLWSHAFAPLGASSSTGFHACEFSLDGIAPVPGEDHVRGVHGWAVDQTAARQPAFVYFAAAGRIVGVAVSGGPRPDVAEIIDPKGALGGFAGYVLESTDDPLTVVCPDSTNGS